ncbi:polyprotein of EF-Ts, chloroplastic isoform X2 [Juglans microcarpa x Juglans regia]|uniref:polyprotein of EF-Ts, chloroplastic isoform X2 n=1 Tax=Juglans microcarpa x Juglans regia TaxID=2249226 RepID=UPI001B7EBC12|nr:polyprotein of EF-Ts, chloroplastic isoform X2 [Juglans microcarpa x Juglans regia]
MTYVFQVNMMSVMPCSISNVSLIPGTTFTTRMNNCLTRVSLSRKCTKLPSSTQKYLLPLSTSIKLLPQHSRGCSLHHISRTNTISATGIDVAVEEPGSPIPEEVSGVASEVKPDEVGSGEESSNDTDSSPAPTKSQRPRPVRKSEMPPVKDEELVPGAAFTGKVRSIQPFGAFVDFGAFTDGLVHVSRLSDSYVKDVGSIVSVGQEVQVRLVEANMETGRISLTMRGSDDISTLQQRKDSPPSSDKAGAAKRNTSRPSQRKDEMKRSSKFVKGQDLQGTVKNLTRSGAFISLPEGEEGFLPTSEESNEGFENIMGNSSLQIGQEVSVRVLRFSRGKVTLTMKREEDGAKLDLLLSQHVVHTATNPFVLAFRKNKEIASFLDERQKLDKEAEKPEIGKTPGELEEKVDQKKTERTVSVSSTVDEIIKDNEASSKEADVGASTLDKDASTGIADNEDEEGPASSTTQGIDSAVQTVDKQAQVNSEALAPEEITSMTSQVNVGAGTIDDTSINVSDDGKDPESTISSSTSSVDGAVQTMDKAAEVSSEILVPEGSISAVTQIIEEAPPTDGLENDGKAESAGEISGKSLSSESPVVGDVIEDQADVAVVSDDTSLEVDVGSSALDDTSTNVADDEKGPESALSSSTSSVDGAVQTIEKAAETSSEILASEGSISAVTQLIEEAPSLIKKTEEVPSNDGLENDGKSDSSVEISGQSLSSQSPAVENVIEDQSDVAVVSDEINIKAPSAENDPPSTPSEENKVGPNPDKNGSITSSDLQPDTPAQKTEPAISPALVKQLREETGAGMMDCKKALSETGGDVVKALEFLRKKGLASAEKKASRATAEGRIGSYIHDSRIGVLVEVNCETDFVSRGDIFKELVDDLAMQVAACPQVQYVITEDVPKEIVNKEREIEMQREDLLSKPEQIRSKIVEGRITKRLEELALLDQPYIKNDKLVVKDWVKQTIATIGENIKVKRFVRYNLGEGLEKKSQDFAAEVAAQTEAKVEPKTEKEQPAVVEAKETIQKPPTVTVSAALVKQLRDESGAGMMDCKKALAETGGDLEKAQEYLRKKGLSTADKKSSRLAAEGRIGSYIHDSRIGVLIEVNCETDFVGRSENFKELVDDLAMQVVACPQVQFVSTEDIPESIKNKEKELEMQREDILSKPENIRERIVEGRISKRLGEMALLEQPFIKNDSILVKDLVKQTVAAIGENIKVRRFVRFTLGETVEHAKTGTEA